MRITTLFLLSIASVFAQYVPNHYIVELQDEATSIPPAERRQRTRDRQAKLEGELRARGFKTLDRTEIVANTVMVSGPDDGSDGAAVRAQLSRLAGVRQVHKVRIFHPTLERAAQVHDVAAAWERLGIANSGAGMKIGILDSGIELTHPGFQASLPALDGYPKVNNARDTPYTNSKVIVARSYYNLWLAVDPNNTVLDRAGHGTAVAMSAAGSAHDSPVGRLSGMAPAAYLGVYKIFGTPGYNDGATDEAILKAIEDAVADGMDVINMSFGSMQAPRPENDILVRAVAKAEAAGVIVVISAGNDGPGLATLSSPGTAPAALTVGATENGRTFLIVGATDNGLIFAGGISASDGTSAPAVPGSATASTGSISASMLPVSRFDPSGLACTTLPPKSLSGQIVLILRGTCNFEQKLMVAAAAGAVAAVVYSDAARATDLISMNVGAATLPAVFITYSDGKLFNELLRNAPSVDVKIDLAPKARFVSPYRLGDFSSKGPIPGVPIKPDLVAVGTNVFTAAQTNYPDGDVYSKSGYYLVDGTSFSAPITAGAAAVLKAARPGLRPVDYRSLLVNAARPLFEQPELTVAQVGGGFLSLTNSLDATLRFNPISISFSKNDQSIEVASLSSTAARYRISVEPKEGTAPRISASQFDLEPNATASLMLSLDLAAAQPGAYSGVILVQAEGGAAMRVPYWFGKAKANAKEIQIVDKTDTARSLTVQQDLVFFRLLDENGVALTTKPRVNVIAGTVEIREVQDRDFDIAGAFGLEMILGRGTNTIEIDAGNGLVQRLSFTGG